ncbi:MAG: MmcQ/YjbR family DNA-binding protein [Clostridiales bacterium]|nr:MmcQ/YjbR family DNA-binding protein [Clostridiales bacterium]
MTRNQLEEYIATEYSEKAERPFAKDDNTVVFRHKSNDKWFAVIMSVHCSKLGLAGDKTVDIVNLKCAPEMMGSFMSMGGIYPAYHMNKTHWLSIVLNNDTDDDTLRWLLEISYELTNLKLKKHKSE